MFLDDQIEDDLNRPDSLIKLLVTMMGEQEHFYKETGDPGVKCFCLNQLLQLEVPRG